MFRRLILLVVVLGVPASVLGVTSMSNYRTFTREILTPDHLNNLQTSYTNKLNEIIPFVPSGATGDSLKAPTVSTDTLATKSTSKVTLKDPLVSLSASDSLLFHLANIKRANLDSIYSGYPGLTPTFSVAVTAGRRVRFNLLDLDSLRLRDSLYVAPGAKIHFPRITLDSLGAPVVSWPYDFTAGKRLRVGGLISADSLRIVDSLTAAAGSKTVFLPGSSVAAASIDVDTLAGAGAVVPDNYILGLGSGKATVEFDDQTADEVNILNATLSVGSSTPGTTAGQVYTSGSIFINDNANTSGTIALTINQGPNDDEILALKSSDVSHGVTSVSEDDTYGRFKKLSATNGGLFMTGFTAATDGHATYIQGISNGASTTHSAAGKGIVQISTAVRSGTGQASAAANGNLLCVDDNGSVRFIVDVEGDLFADGSAPTIYDGPDDVALISAFDHHQSKISGQKLIESEWEDYTRYNEKDLIEMGLIGGPRVGVDPSQRGLINYTGMVRLHNGAIRQVGREVNELDHRTETLAEDVAYLKAVHGPDPTWADVELVMLKWLYSLFGKGN